MPSKGLKWVDMMIGVRLGVFLLLVNINYNNMSSGFMHKIPLEMELVLNWDKEREVIQRVNLLKY